MGRVEDIDMVWKKNKEIRWKGGQMTVKSEKADIKKVNNQCELMDWVIDRRKERRVQ